MTSVTFDISPRVASRRFILAFLSRSGAWFLVAVGSLVLVGWAFNLGILTRVVSGWASMKPNTALCSLAIGFALLHDPHKKQIMSFLLAATVSVIVTLTLLEYASGADLG